VSHELLVLTWHVPLRVADALAADALAVVGAGAQQAVVPVAAEVVALAVVARHDLGPAKEVRKVLSGEVAIISVPILARFKCDLNGEKFH